MLLLLLLLLLRLKVQRVAPVQLRHLLAERHKGCRYAVVLHLLDAWHCVAAAAAAAAAAGGHVQQVVAPVDGEYDRRQPALAHHGGVDVEPARV